MGASGASVGLAFGINIGLCIVVFFLFAWLRVKAFCKRFYAPKRFDTTVVNKPKRLPPGLFAWMGVIYSYPETEIINVAGLDTAMYIRVLQFGWEIFLKVSLVVCVILLPINITGDHIGMVIQQQNLSPPPPSPPPPLVCGPGLEDSDVKAKKYTFTNFDRLSLANLDSGDAKLWAHCICLYIITYIVLTTLWRYNTEATLLRLAFLANAPRGGPSHTVLITDIPGMRYGTIIWYLRGLVGSTLFVMLPGSLKKKVLDSIETGIKKTANTVNITKAIPTPKGDRPKKDKVEDEAAAAAAAAAKVKDAYTVTAEENSKLADEIEAAQRKKQSGILNLRQRKAPSVIASDPTLDPWWQAGQVLGDSNEPAADKVKGFIHNEIEFSYGRGCVASVNPVWDVRSLMPLVNEYEATKAKLEDHVDQLASLLKRRKPIKPKTLMMSVTPQLLGSWGVKKYGMKPTKVDKIVHWSERLRYLLGCITDIQKQCLTKAIPSAFVTVETRAVQTALASSLYHHDEGTWQVQGAPEPKEIVWANLGMRKWERYTRFLVLWIVYLLMVVFFLIPIAAVQALIEVPKLATIPVLGTIVNLPFIKQVLEAIVPGLVLLIFLAILPMILAFMCRLAGMVSVSQIDFGVVTQYFYFQFVTVFFGSIVAGSLLSQLRQFVSNPSSIISILGAAIPMTSTFFINFILVAGIGKMGIKHLRIPGLVIFWLLSKIAATPRARAKLWADQFTLYGPTVAYHTITFLMGLAYACINPIIAPVCLLYYSFGIISEKYNNLYVFKRVYESGGRLWLAVFNQFVFCLYVMQIFLIIVLAIKRFPVVFILIPAPLITLVFHIVSLKFFRRPWTLMSAHDAAQLDRNDAADKGQEGVSEEELQLIRDMYLAPVFKIKDDDMDDLLRESDITRRRVNGEKLEDIEAGLEDLGYVSCDEETPDPALATTSSAGTSQASATPAKGTRSGDSMKPLVTNQHPTSSEAASPAATPTAATAKNPRSVTIALPVSEPAGSGGETPRTTGVSAAATPKAAGTSSAATPKRK